MSLTSRRAASVDCADLLAVLEAQPACVEPAPKQQTVVLLQIVGRPRTARAS